MRWPDPRSLLMCAVLLLATACASTPRNDPTRTVDPIAQRSINAAMSLLERGQTEAALEQARLAVRTDSRSARARLAEAMVLDAQSEEAAAGEAFSQAYRLAPGDGAVLNAYAVWLCRMDRAIEAQRLFTRTLDDPTYRVPEQSLANAAACSAKNGELEAAEMQFRAALGLRPTHAPALVGMARLLLKKGDPLGARAFLQRREALSALGMAELLLAIEIEESAGNLQAAQAYRTQLAELIAQLNQSSPP